MNRFDESDMVETIDTLRAQYEAACKEVDVLSAELSRTRDVFLRCLALLAATSNWMSDQGMVASASSLDRQARRIEAVLEGQEREEEVQGREG